MPPLESDEGEEEEEGADAELQGLGSGVAKVGAIHQE